MLHILDKLLKTWFRFCTAEVRARAIGLQSQQQRINIYDIMCNKLDQESEVQSF